jgi:resuscitation-promoting factor RpfB
VGARPAVIGNPARSIGVHRPGIRVLNVRTATGRPPRPLVPFRGMTPASPFPGGHRRARNLSRRVRGLAGVVLLAAAAAGLYGFSSVIEVAVDGEVLEVRTYAGTVGDVLDTLDVEVGTADVVTPPLDASIDDGMAIEVDRAITVEVTIDGSTARRITAPVDTVGGVLREADMRDLVTAGAKVIPAVGASVVDGDVIDLTLPTVVWVVGRRRGARAVDPRGGRRGSPRRRRGGDRSRRPRDPAAGRAAVGATRITVQRVEVVEETEEVVLEHDTVERESDELRKGRTRVETEGRDGLRIDTYEVTLVDGEETERELVDEAIEREPRDEVVLIGTYEPPPPPSRPAASSSSGSSSPATATASTVAGDLDGRTQLGAIVELLTLSSSSGSSSSSVRPPRRTTSATRGTAVWERLARCESNGNWQHRSGNGLYYGGLQFHPDTWRTVGGTGMPHEASKAEQIRRGRILQARLGWGQWPACSRMLGLR